MEYGLVALWLAMYLLLGAIAVPLAARIFRRFDDRGAALALPVAHVVLFIVAYWVGRFHVGLALPAGLVVIAVGSVLAYRADTVVDPRGYLEAMAVFAVVFLAVVATRAVDPGIYPVGGERFLDFGLVKTILRAKTLPPEDMWFAGRPVQYYYGGQLLAALLVRLTGTAARYGYNLSFAGFSALLVTAVYGTTAAIGAERGYSRRLAGVLGAFFVGAASNLYTVGRLVLIALPDSIATDVIINWGRPYRELFFDGNLPIRYFSYAHAKDDVIQGTLTQFPLYAILDGELHPHFLSTPFLATLVALCFAYYRTPVEEVGRRRALIGGFAPPVVGMLAVTNTWSFPTGVGVVGLTLLFAPADPRTLLPERLRLGAFSGSRTAREVKHLGVSSVVTFVVGIVAAVWVLPFFLFTASTRQIAVVSNRSGLLAFVLVHGAFLLVFSLVLGSRLWSDVNLDKPVVWSVAAVAGGVFAFVGGIMVDLVALAFVGPLLVAAWALLRRSAVGYEAVLILGGAGIVLLAELFYVREQAASGRLNTVFKAYMQVWVLWAIAMGVTLSGLIRDGFPVPRVSAVERRYVAVGFVAAIVLTTSFYGVFALQNQFASDTDRTTRTDAGPTLNGWVFAQTNHPHEARAIVWLDQRPGQPHILEAPGVDPYTWINPASSLTGLPTVAGWNHETGYRGAAVYQSRVADVRGIYTAEWPEERSQVLDSLRQYGVRYIYVGPTEEQYYGETPNYASHPAISVAWQNERVTIYEVSSQQRAGFNESDRARTGNCDARN